MRDHPVEENLVYTQSWNAHALVTNVSFFYFFFFVNPGCEREHQRDAGTTDTEI